MNQERGRNSLSILDEAEFGVSWARTLVCGTIPKSDMDRATCERRVNRYNFGWY